MSLSSDSAYQEKDGAQKGAYVLQSGKRAGKARAVEGGA